MTLVKDLLRKKSSMMVSVSPTDKVISAAKEMSKWRIGSLMVVEGDRLLGILTERDLLTRVVADRRDPLLTTVAQVMSTDVVVCRPESRLDDCKRIISSCRVRHLPVVDEEGRILGILTSGDILSHELAEQGEAIETLQSYIHGVPVVSRGGSNTSN